MAGKAVELHVAGQTCRVVTTANAEELKVLAAMVEEKLRAVLTPGRPVTTQAMLLAAVALAHDAREQRARADAVAERSKRALSALLRRVDGALNGDDDISEPGAQSGPKRVATKASTKSTRSSGDSPPRP